MNNQELVIILLIDDYLMLCMGVKQFVSMVFDISVVGEVSNGEQGIDLVELFDFDLIFFDLNMLGMNGFEMLDKLCEKVLLGCIVVFSVFNYEEDVVMVLKCGVDGYLLKDMELEDLFKVL